MVQVFSESQTVAAATGTLFRPTLNNLKSTRHAILDLFASFFGVVTGQFFVLRSWDHAAKTSYASVC